MVFLWLRNEVFNGVLPLKNLGATQNLNTSSHGPNAEKSILNSLFNLSKSLRQHHPKLVCYTLWISESWRLLHWREPAARIFWEMLALYHEQQNPKQKRGLTISATKKAKYNDKNIEIPIASLIIFLFLHLHPDASSSRSNSSNNSTRESPWPTDDISTGFLSPRSPSRFNMRYSFPSSPGSHSPRGPGFGVNSPSSPHHTRSLRLQTRCGDEAHRVQFIKGNLLNLLWLITLKAKDSEEMIHQTIIRSDLSLLHFLFSGGSSFEEEHPNGLMELCPMLQKNYPDNNRSKGKRNKKGQPIGPSDVVGSALDVCSWMALVLTVNDVLYPIPPWPSLGAFDSNQNHENIDDESMSPARPTKKSSIVEPTKLIEPMNVGVPVNINSVLKTTVYLHSLTEDTSADKDVHISHCTESYLYILTPSKHTVVLGCVDCTIVLGPSAGLVRFEECLRVTLVVACCRICIVNCCESSVYLYTPTRPLFIGDNRSCLLAPYNTTYPHMVSQLVECRLLMSSQGTTPPARNLWASPLDLSSVTSASASAVLTPRAAARAGADEAHPHVIGGGTAAVTQMPPESFYSISIPLIGSSEYTLPKNPFPLPPEYVNVLKDRETQVQSIQHSLMSLNLGPNAQLELEEAVRSQFADWLVSSGNLRQVLDLVQLERGPGTPQGLDEEMSKSRSWSILSTFERGSPAK